MRNQYKDKNKKFDKPNKSRPRHFKSAKAHDVKPDFKPRTNHAHADWPDMIYGKNAVFEAVRAGRRKVHEVLVSDDPKKFEESELRALLTKKNIEVRFTDQRELSRLAHDGVHQNVVARVARYPDYSLREVLEKPDAKQLVLALDCVQDPQNFGTLCRSALAFGVKYVIVPKDRSASVTPTVCKASAGAVEHLKVISVVNLVVALKEFKEKGFWIYGTSLEERSEDLTTLKPAEKSVIVMGSEGKGLRRLVADTCDILVKIPMSGDFDSLNVAQAGTVVLYDFWGKVGREG